MLKTKTVGERALPEGIEVTFAGAEEGGTAPAPQVYDLVLQAVGRTPNGKKVGVDKAGVVLTDPGFINIDIQLAGAHRRPSQGITVKKGLFSWATSGRTIANGRDEGVTKLGCDDSPDAHGNGKILGGMVGTHAA